MNTLILKILCWINGIKNPFTWAYEQEIKERKMKDNGTNEMPWYMNIFNKDAIENFAKEHEKRNYKSIEHVIDNARFFMESTHELAYDHGYSDGQIEVLDKIRADIESYEADCILADDSKECKECDKAVFGSIYRIIDKHMADKENVRSKNDKI